MATLDHTEPVPALAQFFRDTRIKDALAAPGPDQARKLVKEFLGTHRMRDCSPAQLLAFADLSARCAEAELTREALTRALASGTKLHLVYYKLGRLELSLGRPAYALDAFRKGTEAEPGFPHNWMGATRALHQAGARTEACDSADIFVGFGVRPHGKEEVAVLGDIADFLFDGGERNRALPIYALLRRCGMDRPRYAVRLAEGRIAEGDYAAAAALLRDQYDAGKLDPWGRRALAQALSHLGDHAAALAMARAVAQERPDNVGFTGTYVRILVRSEDIAAIQAALADETAPLSSDDRAELAARVALSQGDVAPVAEQLAGIAFAAQDRFFYLCLEAAYAALDAGRQDLASALARRLLECAPDDPAALVLQIDMAFRRHAWEDAGPYLALLGPDSGRQPQIAMKRLEYACFMRQWEDAEQAASLLREVVGEQGQFLLPLFRFLAEKQDWQGLIDRALPWLDTSFRYDQIGYVLFRAAHNTGRQADMLGAIEALAGWSSAPDLLRLRNTILYDQAHTLPAIDQALADPMLAADPGLTTKLHIRRGVLARAEGAGQRQAIFFCTDRNYLCATIVALHGLTKSIDPRGADLFVVTDDDIAELTRAATRAFTDAGYNLTIVPASSVVAHTERLAAAYGLFTSGHRLASAAYYRIYFARHLQGRGLHERALYIDSDVVFAGRLDSVLSAPLGDLPIAARVEPDRPEVLRAIAHHGFRDGGYFNSGVLLFDLRHPELLAGIDASIAAILDDSVTLLYHDQCALNLGFRDRFHPLDMNCNFPVGETTSRADIPPDAHILHFLDRPKPWSAAHQGEASLLWFERWQDAAEFIGAAAAAELFAQIQD